MLDTLRGKVQAARALLGFTREFRNWPEVWAAYRVGQPLPPLRLRRGPVLHHGPRDSALTIHREVWIDGCYTPPGFYTPKAGDVVLDIGANVGIFAVWAATAAPGVRVHCFEPGPAPLENLRRNVEENGLGEAVTIHPMGVSDRRGSFDFHATDDAGHGSMFAGSAETSSATVLQVECVTLADALERAGDPPRVALLKVDVEGAEVEILGGAGPEGLATVERAVVEYHDLLRPGCRAAVVEALEAAGFRCVDRPEPKVPGLGLILATRDAAGLR